MLGATLTEISMFDGVISANMVFEQIERSGGPETDHAAFNRRELLKAHAAAVAAAAAGIAPGGRTACAGGVGRWKSNGRRRRAASAAPAAASWSA